MQLLRNLRGSTRLRGNHRHRLFNFPFRATKPTATQNLIAIVPTQNLVLQNKAQEQEETSTVFDPHFLDYSKQILVDPKLKSVPYEFYKSTYLSYLEDRFGMASSGDSQLFDESFTITTIDNQKYERVARLGGSSADNLTVMTLDINTELYPCNVGETIQCVIANSLSLDGTKDDGKGWRNAGRDGAGGETTLANMFDYVCHGKIYKFEDGEDGQTIKVYISFGGLLMALEGPYKKLTPLRQDYVYLLVKK